VEIVGLVTSIASVNSTEAYSSITVNKGAMQKEIIFPTFLALFRKNEK
jgi:hypothetical protein